MQVEIQIFYNLGEYGVPLPFYFPFMVILLLSIHYFNNFFYTFIQPSYWKKSKSAESDDSNDDPKNREYFEKEDFIAKPTIQIKNISKVNLLEISSN